MYLGYNINKILDPYTNIEAGVKYLDSILCKEDNDLRTSLLSYGGFFLPRTHRIKPGHERAASMYIQNIYSRAGLH